MSAQQSMSQLHEIANDRHFQMKRERECFFLVKMQGSSAYLEQYHPLGV